MSIAAALFIVTTQTLSYQKGSELQLLVAQSSKALIMRNNKS